MFRSNLRQNVFKNFLNSFELYFRLQHRRKTKNNEENHCDRFDQPANFSLKHSALQTKETANYRIKIHIHTCLPSKKTSESLSGLLRDFQAEQNGGQVAIFLFNRPPFLKCFGEQGRSFLFNCVFPPAL